jgi:hypothetical protein
VPWWMLSRALAAAAVALLFALFAAGAVAGSSGSGSWLGWGNGQERWDAASSSVSGLQRRFVVPLPGRITNQVLAANGSYYVATSSGLVVAFDGNGFERWQTDVGQFAQPCKQLDGYGVTGTGVIDPSTGTLYVADAFGRLHALSLATGAERAGWPVQVYTDNNEQLDWAGLTLVDGAVYVPVAAYCDAPSLGGIYRVDLTTKAVTDWVPVPASLGGGGGPWGWGGLAYSSVEGALFTATSNAFGGGTNVGPGSSEFVGYGEHLVELAPDLTVRAASHPSDLIKPLDLDLTGSPLDITRKGCGELIAADDKDDTVYGWRTGDIAAGPIWEVPLETFNPGNPLVTQLAWSQTLSSLYSVTGTHLVRIAIGTDCMPTATWKIPLGTNTENGSPTVAGNTVWFAVNKTVGSTLNGYDATTGRLEQRLPLGGLTLTAPTVINGRLLIGTFTGLVEGFAAAGVPAGTAESPPAQAETTTEVSRLDAEHEWEGRGDGVYSTDNGGKTWRRIYPQPANAVVRLSATAGVIDVSTSPGSCMCDTRKLWTSDAGRTWHESELVDDDFTGSGTNVYWWDGGTLHALTNFPGKATKTHVALNLGNGTIVDAATVPGGVVALVSNRVDGLGWDTNPRVAVIRSGKTQLVTLPAQTGDILTQRLLVRWPRLIVTGTDFDSAPLKSVGWVSTNGGATWSVN